MKTRRALVLAADLPPRLTHLWELYSHLWRDMRRQEAYDMIPELMDEIAASPEHVTSALARECCRVAFEKDSDFPMHPRLPCDVLIPFLADAVHAGRMPEVLWTVKARRALYGRFFDQRIAQSDYELIRLALDIEPDCREAAELLIADLVDTLEYITHHMPDGYLGPTEKVESLIQELESQIGTYDAVILPRIVRLVQFHRALLREYQKWHSLSPGISFAGWCKQHNLKTRESL